MSEAIELYKKSDQGNIVPCGVFYCSECRSVYGSATDANNCHGDRLCECGQKIELRYRNKCNACHSKEWHQKSAATEFAKYEKATKITYSEYKGGMIYDADKYYEDLESALDGYDEGQEPEYVWACKDIGVVKATTESLYENMLENMWEDADVYDLNGVDELEAAVAAFNEANKSISVWEPDYSTAILVPRDAESK